MRLIVATHNNHKLDEIKELTQSLDLEIVGLRDLNFNEDIIENGSNFIENAMIKAKTIQKLFPNDAILADDSGFCVTALNDEPGLFSSRYLGEETSFEVKMSSILKELEQKDNRNGYFTCAMVYLYNKYQFITQKYVYGTVAKEIKGNVGFGYDPIFIPKGFNESFGENQNLKQQISHRTKALKEVIEYVENTQL